MNFPLNCWLFRPQRSRGGQHGLNVSAMPLQCKSGRFAYDYFCKN